MRVRGQVEPRTVGWRASEPTQTLSPHLSPHLSTTIAAVARNPLPVVGRCHVQYFEASPSPALLHVADILQLASSERGDKVHVGGTGSIERAGRWAGRKLGGHGQNTSRAAQGLHWLVINSLIFVCCHTSPTFEPGVRIRWHLAYTEDVTPSSSPRRRHACGIHRSASPCELPGELPPCPPPSSGLAAASTGRWVPKSASIHACSSSPIRAPPPSSCPH